MIFYYNTLYISQKGIVFNQNVLAAQCTTTNGQGLRGTASVLYRWINSPVKEESCCLPFSFLLCITNTSVAFLPVHEHNFFILDRFQVTSLVSFLHRIDHFTVACLGAWPLNENAAGGDPVCFDRNVPAFLMLMMLHAS